MSMEKPAFPAEVAPDILNHWTAGLAEEQILDKLRDHPPCQFTDEEAAARFYRRLYGKSTGHELT